MSAWTIERTSPGQWERVRAVRLQALADAPDAFGTTLAEDEARPLPEWRARLARSDVATFLAVADGRDGGIATGAPFEGQEGAAGLFSMWTAPEFRGRGIGRALVEAVVSWARGAGYRRVLLDVADGNLPAIRLYARCGFAPTGETGTLPPPRQHVPEHRRALALG